MGVWNHAFQTVFCTGELSTNSLGDFVVFWNHDSQRSFQPIPWWILWGFGIMISRPFSTQRTFQLISFGDFMAPWDSDSQTVFCTAELSTNSLGNFVSLWKDDFHTISHTAELSTNTLGDFVGFWNYDFQTK